MDYQLVSTLASQLVRRYPVLADNPRVGRAMNLVRQNRILPLSDHFIVISSDGLHHYRVSVPERSCTCPDSGNGYVCKHRIAVQLYLMQED